jgi:carboxylesterase
MADAEKKPKRWRTLIAFAIVALGFGLILLNFVSGALVTRYDATATRDPGSPYLAGMTPRTLGPENSERAVLFIHGFVGAQSNFNTLPDAAAEAGWYVETMRLPGHGTSPREFERTTGDELINGVQDAVTSLKERYGVVVVVAHSMGGALSTIVAARESMDGLVLCAPFFRLKYDRVLGIKTKWLAHRASPLIRWLPGRPGRGPVAKPEGRQHIQCYRWIPMAGALTALEIGERANAPEVLAAIRGPVLAIHSKKDSVTAQTGTAEAVKGMTGARVETCWLEKSDHVIFWDYEEDVVTGRVLEFLEEIEANDDVEPGFRE